MIQCDKGIKAFSPHGPHLFFPFYLLYPIVTYIEVKNR